MVSHNITMYQQLNLIQIQVYDNEVWDKWLPTLHSSQLSPWYRSLQSHCSVVESQALLFDPTILQLQSEEQGSRYVIICVCVYARMCAGVCVYGRTRTGVCVKLFPKNNPSHF